MTVKWPFVYVQTHIGLANPHMNLVSVEETALHMLGTHVGTLYIMDIFPSSPQNKHNNPSIASNHYKIHLQTDF